VDWSKLIEMLATPAATAIILLYVLYVVLNHMQSQIERLISEQKAIVRELVVVNERLTMLIEMLREVMKHYSISEVRHEVRYNDKSGGSQSESQKQNL
jgi:regulator of replication initiation timing